jgi:GT2 family glycosyltransferase
MMRNSLAQGEESPLVSVVIVTWNRKDDLLTTVGSIHEQSYRHYEIVVVDNASTDGTVEALQRMHPAVRIVALPKNLGASGGRNPGITAARGEIIFLLDSDASLGRDTLVSVVQKFQANPRVGAIYCKIVNAYTGQLDDVGGGWSFTEKDKADQDREFLSYSFSEGGSAIRKEVFEHAGLFWEPLFFGGEGEELSLRIWDAGYQILYCPSALVYHRVSPRERVASDARLYFNLRNMLYIFLVRYPWWMVAFFAPLKIGASLVQGLRRRRPHHIIKALFDVTRQLPFLLGERQPIRNQTARDYIRLLREHGRLSWDLMSWLKYKT